MISLHVRVLKLVTLVVDSPVAVSSHSFPLDIIVLLETFGAVDAFIAIDLPVLMLMLLLRTSETVDALCIEIPVPLLLKVLLLIRLRVQKLILKHRL